MIHESVEMKAVLFGPDLIFREGQPGLDAQYKNYIIEHSYWSTEDARQIQVSQNRREMFLVFFGALGILRVETIQVK